MDKVVHFEIPGDDVDRMKQFYQQAFGWKMQDYPEMKYVIAQTMPVDENRMPMESGAINGGIMERNDRVKAPSFAIEVADIDAAIARVTAAGGTVLTEKMPVGDMGIMAYFTDTEGNVLSLWQTLRQQ